jgi:peptidoglycan/xylan/chitin deacetylase (PgdA/CDA1 family)
MHKVIVYHSISAPEMPLPADVDVSPEKFESHLWWLAKRPERVRPLRDLLSISPGRGLYSITFDDGFRDNLTVALPLLEKYNLPMTLFATADFIGRKGYLSKEELRTMAKHPLVTIGSHGLFHRHYSKLPAKETVWELRESKAILENFTGKRVDLLAYPFGDCSPETESLSSKCGFQAAWSVWNGMNTPFSRWRVPLGRKDNLLRFIAKTSKVYFPVKKMIKPPMN